VKPQYIFSAVIAICLMMAALLPQLAPSPAAAAPDSAYNAQSVLAMQALVPDQLAVQEEAVQEAAEVQVEPAVQLEPEQAQVQVITEVEPPVFEPPSVRSAVPESIPIAADLEVFASTVQNNQPNRVVGLYVDGVFALPVHEQPGGQENYVSAEDNTVTQYATPGQFGVVALLAHNYLSGRVFFQLRPDQEIVLVYGDRRLVRYRISSIQNYQAISPTDVRSDFRDLNSPEGGLLSYSQLFNKVYTTTGTLVLQTCIEANGDLSWGRVFIIANPVQ
jgi:hypothetical protein